MSLDDYQFGPGRRLLTHTKRQPWPQQFLFNAVVYAVLLLTLAVTGWAIVAFVGWAW